MQKELIEGKCHTTPFCFYYEVDNQKQITATLRVSTNEGYKEKTQVISAEALDSILTIIRHIPPFNTDQRSNLSIDERIAIYCASADYFFTIFSPMTDQFFKD